MVSGLKLKPSLDVDGGWVKGGMGDCVTAWLK